MKINKVFEIQLKLIVNMRLFKRNIIDEYTFSKVNDKLLKKLKSLQDM